MLLNDTYLNDTIYTIKREDRKDYLPTVRGEIFRRVETNHMGDHRYVVARNEPAYTDEPATFWDYTDDIEEFKPGDISYVDGYRNHRRSNV